MNDSTQPSASPLAIGSRRELFVDDYLIDRLDGVSRKLHEPRPAGTAIVFDQPWEGCVSGYASIIKDGDKYGMYYRGSSDPAYSIEETKLPDEEIVPQHPCVICYAESSDGINWTRPNLGLCEFNGSKDNNIVREGIGSQTFSPFLDTNPAAPASERYKAVASSNKDWDTGKPALIGFVSPDGKQWKQVENNPLITEGKFDSLNLAFWDAERGQYTAIYRDFVHGVRTIKYASSPDFKEWTPGVHADFGDAPPTHLYTTATMPYPRAPHIYVALPRRFMPWKTYFEEMKEVTPGVSDVVFMSTRDGVHWNRFEEAYIRPGLNERNWGHRANTPSKGIVQNSPEEMSIYVEREYTFATNQIERLTLRTDGFVSAHAGYPEGELITKPLVFSGTSLLLNYSTSGQGSIRVEIQDEAGHPISGFLLEESPLIFGDKIDAPVEWPRTKGRTDPAPLENLACKTIRLRFVMRDADIYSLQFK
ncbi:MAG: hypothetical protein CMI16_08880 [Opitutaceae bacterium]|nr:hypothetical protein [Opitutaceae bacterium]